MSAHKTPTVSVLVTIYNREHILQETVESILNSTYQDYELILVDDCSKDKSYQIACELAKADSRIHAYKNPENLGDYGNRNAAAAKARGKYIKYVDADDLVYPHTLEVMVNAMERFPEAALALSINKIDLPQPFPFYTSAGDAMRAHFNGSSLFGVGPTAAIIRNDAFTEVGGFSGRQFIGDTELWYKLTERWPLVSLPPALVWWRQHEGQQMRLELKTPQVLNIRNNLEIETLEATQHLNDSEKKRIAQRIRQTHARRLLSMMLKRKSPGIAWKTFQDSGLTFPELLQGFKGYPKG
ncbi:glycosyltransferase family 2 protein [Cerasicoccus frondis]|uniref:glycosyltransferase family 2 protein n=1 Tax=Cerasicoccus frondis TaxID=490090 RepID=UPI002852A61F|nr:glycosyltransferase family A protein [Cerasicoccus frondis]